jgi:hypothetical protein
MSCKRICRELLWLARFGEFGPSSAPHLEHLAGCRQCRDEIGFDRALVQQLRTALAARIESEEPSPNAWESILQRAQAPDRGLASLLREHAAALASRLRTATAISAVALAGVIAVSTNVAITHPEAGSAETEVRTSAAGELFELQPLIPRPRGEYIDMRVLRAPVVFVPAPPSDPETDFMASVSATATTSNDSSDPEPRPQAEETTFESFVFLGPTVHRLTDVEQSRGAPVVHAPSVTPTEPVIVGGPY